MPDLNGVCAPAAATEGAVNYYDMLPGLRRLIYGFLVAVLLAVLFSIFNDLHAAGQKPKPTTPDAVIVPPSYSFCQTLEPYGWWWFFWGCNEGGK
jgi:hypothetical protein